jgi:hypothetical protein
MRRRLLAGGALAAVVVVAVVLVVVDPFGGAAPAASIDNGTQTTTQTVTRRDLSSQTQVSATLGYAGTSTISAVSGTAPSALQQAQQASETAQATLATDQRALAQAHATLDADTRKVAVDCKGANAAGGTGAACTTDVQALAADRQTATNADAKVQADRISANAASTALTQAQASATPYGQSAVYTMLPKAGAIVRRGEALYAIDGQPVSLLYGAVPASRAFAPGMSPGRDVAELNANLRALGYGAPTGDAFTAATSAAIDAFQHARGLSATGTLLLGAVVFEPGAVRVTAVTPAAGSAVQAGAVLSITSTRRVVTIALDASQQSSVKVGDAVTITLPDNTTTPGRVTYVGTVATTPSSDNNGGSSTPTVEVDVTPSHPAATGRIDQASVDVSITTDSVKNVLAVPVNALLALTGGGYAVEEVAADGTHHLVGVTLGLFDDAEGLVEVSGSGVAAGQRVVVPSS